LFPYDVGRVQQAVNYDFRLRSSDDDDLDKRLFGNLRRRGAKGSGSVCRSMQEIRCRIFVPPAWQDATRRQQISLHPRYKSFVPRPEIRHSAHLRSRVCRRHSKVFLYCAVGMLTYPSAPPRHLSASLTGSSLVMRRPHGSCLEALRRMRKRAIKTGALSRAGILRG
jgi:hypothetical protein